MSLTYEYLLIGDILTAEAQVASLMLRCEASLGSVFIPLECSSLLLAGQCSSPFSLLYYVLEKCLLLSWIQA